MGWGESAALLTAMSWAISSQINGAIGFLVGASSISLLRMPFQICFLALACLVGAEEFALSPKALLFITLSGVTGTALGDLCLYKAIVIIGTRAGILLQSLVTSFTALFGLLFLGEALSWQLVAGIALATFGVGTAVTAGSERSIPPGQAPPSRREIRQGVFLGLLGAVFFALSLIALRAAMQDGLDSLYGAFLRALLGGAALWLMGIPGRWPQNAVRSARANPVILRKLTLSCLLGALGMWMSCVALRFTQASIAATIMGLQPIWVIITFALWERRLPSSRIVFGALAAFGGTAVVCLR
ncbi:MAG: DMT family transporter [Deltaproteobacteria bacterium]|jgi:drug/metabolite transporter (DMT)-like permease|nr:DMT family transporter [Deltaproteobacteria bacterium]